MKLRSLIGVFLGIVLVVSTANAKQAELLEAKFCVWDPVGSNGPFIAFLKETKLKAISWGIDLKLEPYTDEKVAANDFKAGVCDAVFITLIMGRDFVPFAGAFGAPGGIRDEEQLKTLSATLNSKKALPLIRDNGYELTGIFPIGRVYTFLKDRNEVGVSSVSGKKVAVLNGDVASTKFVETVGASPVHTTLATWAGQFNNGNIDVMFAPALAYNTFELYKGLGENGGIVRYNLLYTVMEMLIHHDRFPDTFGPNMRRHAIERFSELEAIVAQAESEIPPSYWVDLGQKDEADYEAMIKQVRLALRDEKKYDAKAISLLWKIRCRSNPEASECATKE